MYQIKTYFKIVEHLNGAIYEKNVAENLYQRRRTLKNRSRIGTILSRNLSRSFSPRRLFLGKIRENPSDRHQRTSRHVLRAHYRQTPNGRNSRPSAGVCVCAINFYMRKSLCCDAVGRKMLFSAVHAFSLVALFGFSHVWARAKWPRSMLARKPMHCFRSRFVLYVCSGWSKVLLDLFL